MSQPIDLRAIIRARIEALEISQAEAARRGGMHPTRLCDWLAERRDITCETLLSLLDGLDLQIKIKSE